MPFATYVPILRKLCANDTDEKYEIEKRHPFVINLFFWGIYYFFQANSNFMRRISFPAIGISGSDHKYIYNNCKEFT